MSLIVHNVTHIEGPEARRVARILRRILSHHGIPALAYHNAVLVNGPITPNRPADEATLDVHRMAERSVSLLLPATLAAHVFRITTTSAAPHLPFVQ